MYILKGKPFNLNKPVEPVAFFTSKEKVKTYIKNSRLKNPVFGMNGRTFKKNSLLAKYIDACYIEFEDINPNDFPLNPMAR